MPVCNEVERDYGSLYRSVSDHKKMAPSAAELGLLIWPSYPPVLSDISISELLSWVTHFRSARINDILQHVGLHGFEKLMQLSEAKRQAISDYLCSVEEYRKVSRGHSV